MPIPLHGGRIREPRCVPRGLLEYGAEEAAPWSSEVRPRVHTAALEKLHNHPTGEGRRRNIFPRVTPPEDKHPSKSGPPACSRGGPIFLTFAGVFRNAAPQPSQRALSKTHGVLPRRKNRQLLDGRSGRGTRGCWPLEAGSRRITACQTANTTEAKEKPPERGGLEAKYRVHRRVIERGRTSPHRRTVASGRGGQERNPGFPQPEALVVLLRPASDRPCIALPAQCRDRVPRALYAFY